MKGLEASSPYRPWERLLSGALRQSTSKGGECQRAFSAVYREHVGAVARWAYRLGAPACDLEDVVQEVFLVVHRELPQFRGEAYLPGWIFRITENVVRYRRRKDRRRQSEGLPLGMGADAVSPEEDPSRQLERRQAEQRIYRALEAVPDKYRSALVLFELEGLPGEEISRLLGVKVSTLWVWLHRARALFAKRFEELGHEEVG